MAPPFSLSNRATDVRPGCKTQKIAPTLRQAADLVCARTKEREYFKTCIVGHVNCCLQCGPTLRIHETKSRELNVLKLYLAALFFTLMPQRLFDIIDGRHINL
ncbi:hypothetical protein PoB_002458700 [Plakobranchus ocellatus]|uniref:Uncharacterized protein n=1 Tax=Plakobranchus ocellatus TaxID=259542 RepID=A0AAV3ZTT1_9GAST|nr:hypothetical protein PoB_002458700 [Plakobranchus ocellatus]